MEVIDYAKNIDCPESLDDQEKLMTYVICEDSELLFLDAMLTEVFQNSNIYAAV